MTAKKRISLRFTKPARPVVVDSFLLGLDRTATVQVKDALGRNEVTVSVTVQACIDDQESIIRRQSDGWFTVNEAAQIIAEANPGLSAAEVRSRLRDAGRSAQLVIYGDDGFPLKAGASEHDLSDLVKASALRTWLLSTSTGHQFPFVATFHSGSLEQILTAEKEVARFRDQRKPAPLLYGSSITRLTKWIAKETWKPFEAALLVFGYDPGTFEESYQGSGLPGATGLCGGGYVGEARFASARQLADDWERRVGSTPRVIPADFICWCELRRVNTDWLSELQTPIADAAQTGKTSAAERSLDGSSPPDGRALKAVQRGASDDQAVLVAIQALGHDPLAMPAFDNGKASIKGLVLAAALNADRSMTPAKFEHAWKRLKKDRRIVFSRP